MNLFERGCHYPAPLLVEEQNASIPWKSAWRRIGLLFGFYHPRTEPLPVLLALKQPSPTNVPSTQLFQSMQQVNQAINSKARPESLRLLLQILQSRAAAQTLKERPDARLSGLF